MEKCTRRARIYIELFCELDGTETRSIRTKQREEEKRKIQRMFRLIYMQILKGCKRKQFTHTNTNTNMVQIEIFIFVNAHK